MDSASLPMGSEFSDLLVSLGDAGTSLPDMLELVFLYRNDYGNAKKLLDLARRKFASSAVCSDAQINEIKIAALSLQLHHNLAKESDFYDLDSVQDRRIDLLKGFYLYKKRNYEDAHFLFSKAAYKFGMDICKIELGDRDSVAYGDSPRIRCYLSSSEWSKFSAPESNLDFLYKIGKSEVYADGNNIDVRMTKLVRAISEDGCDYDACLSDLEKLKLEGFDFAEVHYLIGKIYHIRQNFCAAKDAYEMALMKEPNYLPAVYNMCRIDGKQVNIDSTCTQVNDYKALVTYKSGHFSIDLNGCSDKVRKACLAGMSVAGGGAVNSGYLRDLLAYNSYEGIFDREVVMNNLGIYEDCSETRLELFRQALENSSAKYEMYIKYNIARATKDERLLEMLDLPEAKLHLALLRNDITTDNTMLKAYLYMRSDREKAKMLFKECIRQHEEGKSNKPDDSIDKHIFSLLCLGSLQLDEYLESSEDHKLLDAAAKTFMKAGRSFYGVNGLAVCYHLMGHTAASIKLISQITHEYNPAYYNLAVFYMADAEYRKAAAALCGLECSNIEDSANALASRLCQSYGCVATAEKLREAGFTLPSMDENSPLSKASAGSDSLDDREAERRKKIRAIEESRKKLRLD